MDGIDLSPRMVDRARATGDYAELRIGPLQAALDRPGAYDLVLAADVLTYVGLLEPVLQGVARTLEPDGLFAWTVQALVRGRSGQAMVLGPDLRFAHARDYLDAAAASAGLTLLTLDDMPVRREQGVPVPGFVGVARRLP